MARRSVAVRATQAGAFAALVGITALPGRVSADDTASQFALALRYEHAEGEPLDYARALELYCDAARRGNADAAANIGWMFLNGRGVARDESIGVAWLRLAAKRGSVQAASLVKHLSNVSTGETLGCHGAGKASDATKPPAAIIKLATKAANKYKLNPKLVLAIIATESAFHADAISPRNAQGLMQLMPETARRFGVKNAFDPAENIGGGTRYLSWLLVQFDGDLRLALAAYNAGEGAVTRYGGVPPYAETRSYLNKIRTLY